MTKDDKMHLNSVQALGCIACHSLGYIDTPAEIHHVRTGQGMAQRASHKKVLPLCPHHHRTGGYGEAFHAGQAIWEKRFGTETELLALVEEWLQEAA
ncbi:Ref family recombination enhancement nuclease [Photobacterium sp. 1_MG-2023]|uniref:Ref family recombination enhancement nuclease n=1 Tax=Photobacterium sp. 1_MG-2023 TaxID=3062646 RepID=UPI0026E42A81|nr:Ref family recombination enhancement nuclease [Photobacterium sp. 1_MG-2023]MDO6706762.1 Ref family recombination enhancement nuclease [Photobacterium sp. 1_MG-2023]